MIVVNNYSYMELSSIYIKNGKIVFTANENEDKIIEILFKKDSETPSTSILKVINENGHVFTEIKFDSNNFVITTDNISDATWNMLATEPLSNSPVVNADNISIPITDDGEYSIKLTLENNYLYIQIENILIDLSVYPHVIYEVTIGENITPQNVNIKDAKINMLHK